MKQPGVILSRTAAAVTSANGEMIQSHKPPPLTRNNAILLFAIIRQAERSVTTGLHGRWDEVRAYYVDERRVIANRVAADLRVNASKYGPFDPTNIRKRLRRRPGWMTIQFSTVLAEVRKHSPCCRIPAAELRFLSVVFSRLIELLDAHEPPPGSILELREDLGLCLDVLQLSGGVIPKAARQVENLGQPPWEKHYRLEEIGDLPEGSFFSPE